MAGQLIPPPGMGPDDALDATPAECISQWIGLMKFADKMLLAGLQREVGPDGDVQEALRKWYAREMDEHDETVRTMLANLDRAEKSND